MNGSRARQAYRAPEYWRTLHGTADLRAVGYPDLPLLFNEYSYANTARAVLRGLRASDVEIQGRNVLDIGSGTGFWIELWTREAAADVSGTDLAPNAVERLGARFPDRRFAVANIVEEPPFPGTQFDVISIMSVLHHVVGEDGFRAALANIASQLAPEGHVVVLDPLVARGRWLPAEAEGSHNVVRTRAQWDDALGSVGLRIVSVHPTAWLFSDPVDGRSRSAFLAHWTWWRAFTHTVRGHDRLATLLLPPFATLDRMVVPRLRTGASTKMLVLARTG